MTDQIDALSAILARVRFAFVDIGFAEDAAVAKAARANRCIVSGQTEATILARLYHAECGVAKSTLQARPAGTCEIVARC